jgi:hypothetical protein
MSVYDEIINMLHAELSQLICIMYLTCIRKVSSLNPDLQIGYHDALLLFLAWMLGQFFETSHFIVYLLSSHTVIDNLYS